MSSFVFISSNKKLFDKFLNSYFNTIDITSRFGNIIPQCNLLISNYKIKKNFSQVATGILIEDDFEQPGSIIWDACQNDLFTPLVISEVNFDGDNISDFYNIEKPNPESPIYRDRANINRLTVIDVYIRYPSYNDYQKKIFGVDRVLDRQSFIEICKSIRQGTETLLFVPDNIEINQLKILLTKLEALEGYYKYSDLSYMQDILKTTEWFYGLNRNNVDVGDNSYSLFIARNSKLIHKIDELNTNGQHKLISFF